MFPRGIPVRSLWLGLGVIAVAVALVLVAFRSHLGLPGQSFTTAMVAADQLDNLREGSQVNLDGVRVGQVRGVEYADGRALVRLQLDPDVELYRDTTAAIRNRSPLGQKILDLRSGTSEAGLLGDDVLPAEQVATVTELDTALSALDTETRDALGSTLRELGAGTVGRGPDLNDLLGAGPSLLDDVGTVSETLAADEADLAALLDAAGLLVGRFEGREPELNALVVDAERVLRSLATDGGAPLDVALEQLPRTVDHARSALADLETLAVAGDDALTELRTGSRALGTATPDLRSVLRDAPDTFTRLDRVTPPAEKAVRHLLPAVEDLRPLAPRIERALRDGRPPIEHLGPYADDIPRWFTNLAAALAHGDETGNYARIQGVATPEILSGLLGTDVFLAPMQELYICSDPYPAPGATYDQRADAECRS
ncbi:MlaD family protein [Nitriliruptor alkaliphilus]|uniref:MlaD family protein n=1 Tax=Nitriliruptor alkaliphilus TaxID=427918 RepID=UPI00069615F3|nr:MlaD family protein [Nitriliruptor alkaliphilus]